MYQHPTSSRSDASHRSAQHGRYRRRIVAALAALAVAGAAFTPAEAGTPNRQPNTPNQCIRLNHGDYNACNVGNSGGGDIPYRGVARTPNQCIRLNHGDYNACNVGNSGGGDLPYKPIG
jgi:aminoglycoside phosphotransferase (APT) family kinase protein